MTYLDTQSLTEDQIKIGASSREKTVYWISTRSDTNRAVQPQKVARGLKEEEGLHYLCSEYKSADQLCGYLICAFVCFCICKNRFSHDAVHSILVLIEISSKLDIIILWLSIRNDITTLALDGHGSETILFFSMGHGKVIHFPIVIWFYKHFL